MHTEQKNRKDFAFYFHRGALSPWMKIDSDTVQMIVIMVFRGKRVIGGSARDFHVSELCS